MIRNVLRYQYYPSFIKYYNIAFFDIHLKAHYWIKMQISDCAEWNANWNVGKFKYIEFKLS